MKRLGILCVAKPTVCTLYQAMPYFSLVIRPVRLPKLSSSLQLSNLDQMSRVMRKPFFCICENKDADNREADQRPCFRYMDSRIPLLSKYKISSLYSSSVTAQPGLCGTWSETPKTGFLTTRLKKLWSPFWKTDRP